MEMSCIDSNLRLTHEVSMETQGLTIIQFDDVIGCCERKEATQVSHGGEPPLLRSMHSCHSSSPEAATTSPLHPFSPVLYKVQSRTH